MLAATLTGGCGRASQPAASTAPGSDTPGLVNGQPDLNGTWGHVTVYGLEFVRGEKLADGSVCVFGCTPVDSEFEPRLQLGFPKYKPEFLAKVADFNERQVELDTTLRCRAPGVPRIGPPGKIVQTATEVVFLYDDYSGSFYRIIPIDGRSHRPNYPATYLGDAVGRFEGDTLIVDTVNFTEDTWLIDNGAFHTRDLKVVERLRRVGNTLEYEVTAHDPAILVEPWTLPRRTLQRSDNELEESPPCQDQDLVHMTDRSHHENPR